MVTDRDVKLEGAVLTETLINALPQVVPDQGMFISNGATGTATVDLRGFGAGRTLVLINGRRLLPGDATYPAADINFVPSALIKRVEVLTGGASSVYGSDAVAGVVNFILETRLDGFRIDGQSSFYQHDNRDSAHLRPLLDASGFAYPTGNTVDGAINHISAGYGFGFAGDRGHVTVYGDYRKSYALTQDRRDYSACTVEVDTPDQDPFCGGSTTSALGTFAVPFTGRFHATADRQFAPGVRFYNFAPVNFYQRPDRRYSFGGFADFQISKAAKPYVEAMFMEDRTIAQIAPSGDFGQTNTINCDNPLLSAQQLALVCKDGNFVGQTPVTDDDGNILEILGSPTQFTDPTTGLTYNRAFLRIARRNIEGGPRVEDLRHRDLRLLGGVKGELGRGLSYDASYLFSRVKQDQLHTNDLLLSRVVNALDVTSDPSTGQPVCRAKLNGIDPNCLPWDVFAAGAVSPEAAAYLSVPSHLSGKVEEKVANVNATVDLGEWGLRSPWAEEAPALNVGAEYRKDTLKLDPDEHFRNADLIGLGEPILPLTGSTSVKELFGEARLPLLSDHLVDSLALEGGYRLSWYRNEHSRISTSSYKVGVDLSPIRGIRIRASQQRAVRAPNVQELFGLTFATGFDIDPCAGPSPQATAEQCAATGVTAAQYGHILRQPDPDQSYNAFSGGNLNVQPERATTRAVGVVFQPQFLRGFSLTLDWFDIRLKGAIASIGAQTIMNTCIATGDPLFCTRIHRDGQGSLWETPDGEIDDTEANLGALKTSGIDIGSSFTRPLGRFGSINAEFQGTWTRHFITDNGGLSTPYDCAGLYGDVCGFPLPRWRHNARLTWQSRGPVSLSMLWRHFSAVPVDRALTEALTPFLLNPIADEIPAQDFFDLTATARFQARYELRVGVRNLFDRGPPIVVGGQAGVCNGFCNGNTYPQLYDPLGRFIFVGATMNFKP